jgi:hypothetical protein
LSRLLSSLRIQHHYQCPLQCQCQCQGLLGFISIDTVSLIESSVVVRCNIVVASGTSSFFWLQHLLNNSLRSRRRSTIQAIHSRTAGSFCYTIASFYDMGDPSYDTTIVVSFYDSQHPVSLIESSVVVCHSTIHRRC